MVNIFFFAHTIARVSNPNLANGQAIFLADSPPRRQKDFGGSLGLILKQEVQILGLSLIFRWPYINVQALYSGGFL